MSLMRWTAVSTPAFNVIVTRFDMGRKRCVYAFLVVIRKFLLWIQVQHLIFSLVLTVSVPGACRFDLPEGLWEQTCQLSQDHNDDFDWNIGHGRMFNGTGPSADHSLS